MANLPTGRQAQVLREIRIYIDRYGFPPTLRGLGQAMGMTHQTIKAHLMLLQKKGLVHITERSARGIRLL